METTPAIKENHMPREFKQGIRTLMLMHRKKDGGKYSKPDRFAPKYIVNTPEEYEERYQELLDRGIDWGVKFRIYASVNPRDLNKGIKEYKRRELEADFQEDESRDRFYMTTKTHFFAALMTPGARAGKNFLIDVDDGDVNLVELLDKFVAADIETHHYYPTVNGTHIITDPFNPADIELPPGVEIKKDGMMLLAWGTPKDSRGGDIV